MTESTNIDETTTEEPKSEGGALRAQLEAALAENKALKQERLGDAFAKAGLDPNTGLGKAIAKEYDGEASPDAILAYAQSEYGWEPDTQPTIRNEISTEQAKLDSAAITAGSIAPDLSTNEALAKAEAEGNYALAGALKAQLLEQKFRAQ